MEHARGAARLQQLHGGGGRRGQRLLADDVFAGGRGGQHDLVVQHGRQAGDDEVDIGRLDDATPVALDALESESSGKARGKSLVDVRRRDQARVTRQRRVESTEQGERRAVRGGHRAGTHERDPDGRRASSHPGA